MIVFIKRNWVKLLSIFVILAITILTVMAAFPASAAEEVPLFTSVDEYTFADWSTVPDDLLSLVNAYINALKSVGSDRFFTDCTQVPKSWVHIARNGLLDSAFILETVEGLFYYLDPDSGSLCVYDRDNRTSHSSHGGSGGSNRWAFTPNDEIYLSGADFQSIIARLNDQYSPKNTNRRHSWITDKAFLKQDYTLSFFCDGYFFNSNLIDVYCIPFYYAGDDIGKYYYSLYQLHYYQEVTQDESGNNVITLYCEYWDWFNKGEHNVMSLGNHYSSTRYKRYMGFSQSEPYMNEYSVYSDYLSGRFGTSRCHSFPSGVKPFLLYDLSDLSLNTRSFWYELARSEGHSLLQANTSENIASVNNADMGLFFGSEPLNMGAYDFDFDKFPVDFTVSGSGDNIYDYSITDNSSGDTTTINNYITNNYTFPDTPTTPNTPTNPTNPGGDLTGNITVSGDVTVGGQVDLNVNVNVNSDDSSGSSVTLDSPDLSDVAISDWYDWMKDSTSDLSGFLSDFLSWLPAGTLSILCVTLAGVCLCRFLGR